MEEEQGFGLGPRGWSSGQLAWPSGFGNGGVGSNGFGVAGALLPPPPAEAPAAEAPALAERWRAALGLPQIPETSPSPPPPPLLRTGSALLLPHSYGSFDSLFAPLSMDPPAAPPTYHHAPMPTPAAPSAFGPYAGFDYGACNTPTAAAALSALGGRPRQATPATAPAATTAAGDEMVACEVVCNGMLGQLLLKAPPLRIRVAATGEVFGPLDFERVAGVLSKKWRHTVHVPATGQTLGEWLDARGMGHLTARGVPTPPAYAPPRAHAAPRPRPLPAHPVARPSGGGQRGMGAAAQTKYARRAGYGPDAWATGAELGSDEEGEDDEDDGAGGAASGSEEYSPAARRRAAARRAARAARFARGTAARGRKRSDGDESDDSGERAPRRRKPSGVAGAKAGMSSRIRMLPAAEPGDAATAWAYAAEAPLSPRAFLRLAPLRRFHELRAAERAGPVALSRVLCGAGMATLTASEAEAELAAHPVTWHPRDGGGVDDVAAALAACAGAGEALLQSELPCGARSRGGYRTALSSHGVLAGAFYAEVALPRLARNTAAARLGWAPDSMPLNGPVGAAAAAAGDATAEPAAAGCGVRGATGQSLRAGWPPGSLLQAGPAFGEGDTVGLYLYQPPDDVIDALNAAPRDVVALAHASARCGLFILSPPQPNASTCVAGSAVLYRVNGGPWALVARDCLPRRPLHLAISLFTDAAVPDGPPALALLNPGPLFAFPPPSADELAAAAQQPGGDAPALRLPAPRALCELGPSVEDWTAQRPAEAEAPAEPEGVEESDAQDEAPPAQEHAATGGDEADASNEGSPAAHRSLVALLAAAAAEAAARLGLAALPMHDGDAV